jgi:thiol-disulfide isomerase/thioredoxin
VSLNLSAQMPVDILDAYAKKISAIKNMEYSAELKQVKNGKVSQIMQRGRVILKREKVNSNHALFIVNTDTIELIYDGRFGFEIDHFRKTVNQVDSVVLMKHPLSALVLDNLLTSYYSSGEFLKKNYLSQDSAYWILRFKTGNKNPVAQVWMNKVKLLPEKIFYQKQNGSNVVLSLKIQAVNSDTLPDAATRISRYIDTYTLLPLVNSGGNVMSDGRDSLVGKYAPDFILNNIISGEEVRLIHFRSKYVLLNFWEVWCGPCRMSMHHLEELYKTFREKGFEIIGLTKDNPAFAWRILADKKVTYLNVSATEKIKSDFKVPEIPQYYLVDREGKIIYASKNGFEQQLEDLIRLLLK